MRWEIACSSFSVDALCAEGPRILAKASWHLPESLQIQQYPEFELSEIEGLFGCTASIDFRCGGPDDIKRELAEGWRYLGVDVSEGWQPSGTLFLHDQHLSFRFFLPENQMISMQSSLLSSLTSSRNTNMVVNFRGYLILGSHGISVQPELKSKWLRGECELCLVGRPQVNLVFGDLVRSAPSWSDLIALYARQQD